MDTSPEQPRNSISLAQTMDDLIRDQKAMFQAMNRKYHFDISLIGELNVRLVNDIFSSAQKTWKKVLKWLISLKNFAKFTAPP